MLWEFETEGLFLGVPSGKRHLSWTLENGQRWSGACGGQKTEVQKHRPSAGDDEETAIWVKGQVGERKTGVVGKPWRKSRPKDLNTCFLLLVLLPHPI